MDWPTWGYSVQSRKAERVAWPCAALILDIADCYFIEWTSMWQHLRTSWKNFQRNHPQFQLVDELGTHVPSTPVAPLSSKVCKGGCLWWLFETDQHSPTLKHIWHPLCTMLLPDPTSVNVQGKPFLSQHPGDWMNSPWLSEVTGTLFTLVFKWSTLL